MTIPEKIWVDFEPRDWPTERIMYGKMDAPYVEYTLTSVAIEADSEAALTSLAERNEALEAALKEIDRLGRLVAHDLIGRVDGGKAAAVLSLADTARAALSGETA